MEPLRSLLAQRHLALLICAAALLMRLLVPTGFMIERQGGQIAITLCPDAASRPVAMPGMHGAMAGHDAPADHGKPELPCAFAGLSAALATVDPVRLAAPLALVAAVGSACVESPAPRRAPLLRPPSTGPPAPAPTRQGRIDRLAYPHP